MKRWKQENQTYMCHEEVHSHMAWVESDDGEWVKHDDAQSALDDALGLLENFHVLLGVVRMGKKGRAGSQDYYDQRYNSDPIDEWHAATAILLAKHGKGGGG